MKILAFHHKNGIFTRCTAEQFDGTEAHGEDFYQFDDLESAKLIWMHRETTKFFKFESSEREFKDPWQNGKTEWHKKYQNLCPIKNQEVRIIKEGETHLADIQHDDGTVIEVQHSYISKQDIKTREDFYDNMIWVADLTEIKSSSVIKFDNDYYTVNIRKNPWLNDINKPLFLDIGNCIVKVIAKNSIDRMEYVCKGESYESFLRREFPLKTEITELNLTVFAGDYPCYEGSCSIIKNSSKEPILFRTFNKVYFIYLQHSEQLKRENRKDISKFERTLFQQSNDQEIIRLFFIYNLYDIIEKEIHCINTSEQEFLNSLILKNSHYIYNFDLERIKFFISEELFKKLELREEKRKEEMRLEEEKKKKQMELQEEERKKEMELQEEERKKEIEKQKVKVRFEELKKYKTNLENKLKKIKGEVPERKVKNDKIKNYIEVNKLTFPIEITKEFLDRMLEEDVTTEEIEDFLKLNNNIKYKNFKDTSNGKIIGDYEDEIFFLEENMKNFIDMVEEERETIEKEINKYKDYLEESYKNFDEKFIKYTWEIEGISGKSRDYYVIEELDREHVKNCKNSKTEIDDEEKKILVDSNYEFTYRFKSREERRKEVYFVNQTAFEILKYCTVSNNWENEFLESMRELPYPELTNPQKGHWWKIYREREKERIQNITREMLDNIDDYDEVKKNKKFLESLLEMKGRILTRGQVFQWREIYESSLLEKNIKHLGRIISNNNSNRGNYHNSNRGNYQNYNSNRGYYQRR